MIHGITPGPLLFRSEAVLVYGIFAALIVANIMMLIVEFVGIRAFIRILSVPKNLLLPIVCVFCVVGAFGTNNRVFVVAAMVVFGVIGYGMKKLNYPQPPLILGFILGPILETNLRRGLMRSQGSFIPFLTSPICCVFLIIAIFTLAMTIRKEVLRMKAQKAAA